MPDTYTKEQIDEAKEWLLSGDEYDKEHATCILSALSTAEDELEDSENRRELANMAAENLEEQRDVLAARCAELEARLRGAGWISVEERLPKEGICVLVAFNDTFRKCEVAYLSTNLSTNSGKIWKGGKYWLYESATHWMPLPEPPAILGEKKED